MSKHNNIAWPNASVNTNLFYGHYREWGKGWGEGKGQDQRCRMCVHMALAGRGTF